MALARLQMPPLPVPSSWFPGHMARFTRMLPSLLTRTDVVLEIRDSRLPLTSINRSLEGRVQVLVYFPAKASGLFYTSSYCRPFTLPPPLDPCFPLQKSLNPCPRCAAEVEDGARLGPTDSWSAYCKDPSL